MSRKNNREPLNIPTITESLRREVLSGRITLWQAANYIKYDLDFKDGRTHLFDEKDLVAA